MQRALVNAEYFPLWMVGIVSVWLAAYLFSGRKAAKLENTYVHPLRVLGGNGGSWRIINGEA